MPVTSHFDSGSAIASLKLDLTELQAGFLKAKEIYKNVEQSIKQTEKAQDAARQTVARLTREIALHNDRSREAAARYDTMFGSLSKATQASKEQYIALSKQRDAMDRAKASQDQLNASLRVAGQVATVALGAATAAAVKLAIDGKNAYRDFTEQANKSQQVFKGAAAGMQEWAKTSVDSLAMTQEQALRSASDFGNLFNTLEMGRGRSAEMSKAMVQLATDLASFHNISTDEAIRKIRSGLVGEMEPLRDLGINLSEATLKQRAFQDGLIKSTTQVLPPQIKMMAAYAEILRQSKDAQGDFARTSGEVANSERILQAQVGELQKTLGQSFMPVWKDLLATTLSLARGIQSVADNLKNVKPSAGMGMFLQNLKDASEAMRLWGDTMAKSNTPMGKATQTADDIRYLKGMQSGAGNLSWFSLGGLTDQNLAVKRNQLSGVLGRYGVEMPQFGGPGAFRSAVGTALGAAQAQYTAQAAAVRAAMKPAGMAAESVAAVPSWKIAQELTDAEKSDAASEKARKRSAMAAARANARAMRERMGIFNSARVLAGANADEEFDSMLGAAASSYIPTWQKLKRGAGALRAGSGMAESLSSTFTGLETQVGQMRYDADRLAQMEAWQLGEGVSSGQIRVDDAIKALEKKKTDLEKVGLAYSDTWKRNNDQIDSMRMMQYRQRSQMMQGTQSQYATMGYGILSAVESAKESAGVKKQGTNYGAMFGDEIAQSFNAARISVKSFADFYRSTMGSIIQATQQAVAKIVAIWATAQIGKSLGKFGGPVGELVGAVGGALFGGIFKGRSVDMGYDAGMYYSGTGGGSSRMVIQFNAPVTMDNPQRVEEYAMRTALHLNRRRRVEA